MVLGVSDEEDVSCGLGFVVVHPGRHVIVPRSQVPLPQVDQRQWFSPNGEINSMFSGPLLTRHPGVFLT